MLEIWEARRLDRILSTGRTKPVILDCEVLVNKTVQKRLMVVKALGPREMSKEGLARAILGNLLARELGIVTGEPAIVNISDSLTQRMRPQLHPNSFNAGLAVGSEYARGLAPINPLADYLPDEIAQITRVYAFDLLVQNPDRRKTNANCAMLGKDVFVYDFDTSFSFLMAIFPDPTPWRVCGHGIHTGHIFHDILHRKKANWTPFLQDLSHLTPTRLNSLADKLPTEWRSQTDKIIEHILIISENADEFALELQQSIS